MRKQLAKPIVDFDMHVPQLVFGFGSRRACSRLEALENRILASDSEPEAEDAGPGQRSRLLNANFKCSDVMDVEGSGYELGKKMVNVRERRFRFSQGAQKLLFSPKF